MENREEALRRIFDATGVDARVTEDQKRELLAHLEDAVEAKVAAGIPEMDAVGQAFSELGPLPRIADELSPARRWLAAWSRWATLKGLALLAILAFFQTFLTPKLVQFFIETGTPAPALMMMFVSSRDSLLPLAAAVLIVLAVLQVVARRKRWSPRTIARLRISSLALYGMVAVCSAGLAVGCGLGIAALLGALLP